MPFGFRSWPTALLLSMLVHTSLFLWISQNPSGGAAQPQELALELMLSDPVAPLPISAAAEPTLAAASRAPQTQLAALRPIAAAAPASALAQAPSTETAPVLAALAPAAAVANNEASPPVAIESQALAPNEHRWLSGEVRDSVQDFAELDAQSAKEHWDADGTYYTATLRRRDADNGADFDRVIVDVVAEKDGTRSATQLQFKRLAFSHFTQLIDRWDENIQVHDDEVIGRFHSNTAVNVSYERKVAPRFLGRVSTAASGFNLTSISGFRPKNEIFPGGIETGTKRIALPRQAVPLNGATVFDVDTRIVLLPNGRYTAQPLRTKDSDAPPIPRELPQVIAAGPDADLHISGTLDGTLLVYSPNHIIVEGALRYTRDPREGYSDDLLGLVADKNVEIASTSRTGPGDLYVDAAIYARRRFAVRDYDFGRPATLYVLGSITTGTVTATEPRYATRVEFDRRLETRRPPGFPMTQRYELEAWDARWSTISR